MACVVLIRRPSMNVDVILIEELVVKAGGFEKVRTQSVAC